MSDLLKCAQCGNKIRQVPGARFTICPYCRFQTNFEQPKPAPVYNDNRDFSTQNVYTSNHQSPEPTRISRIDPDTGRVVYRDEEPEYYSPWKFIGLALLTIFTVGLALPILQTFFIAKSIKSGFWSQYKVFGALVIVATWITFIAFIGLLATFGLWALWLFVAWIIGFLAWRASKTGK